MIETYQIMNEEYHRTASPTLKKVHLSTTRGHDMKLQKFSQI